MSTFIETIIGDLEEKRQYRETEKRAKALPKEYAEAYKEIRNYIFSTSGILHMDPRKTLVDLFEEAAANNKSVVDITGKDVAAFVDELVSDAESYKSHQAKKLNNKFDK